MLHKVKNCGFVPGCLTRCAPPRRADVSHHDGWHGPTNSAPRKEQEAPSRGLASFLSSTHKGGRLVTTPLL